MAAPLDLSAIGPLGRIAFIAFLVGDVAFFIWVARMWLKK